MPPKPPKSDREQAISNQNAKIWKLLYLRNGKFDQAEILGQSKDHNLHFVDGLPLP